MSAGKPRVHWRHGHRYVFVQVEITEKQWLWLHELDNECQIGLGGHFRFAISQYRARLKQQEIELTRRLQKAFRQNCNDDGKC
jgi:hypothetical protein